MSSKYVIDVLKHCKIDLVIKHRCSKRETWKESKDWQYMREGEMLFRITSKMRAVFPLSIK